MAVYLSKMAATVVGSKDQVWLRFLLKVSKSDVVNR